MHILPTRPVYNGPSTDGPLSVCAVKCNILVHFFRTSLWQFKFLYVTRFSCCTLFMLHFFILFHFHVAIFFSCFHVELFFVLHSFYELLYFMLHFNTLQCFRFAFFSCCTLRMLQFFLIALCSFCTISRSVARIPKNIYDGETCNNNYQSR